MQQQGGRGQIMGTPAEKDAKRLYETFVECFRCHNPDIKPFPHWEDLRKDMKRIWIDTASAY